MIQEYIENTMISKINQFQSKHNNEDSDNDLNIEELTHKITTFLLQHKYTSIAIPIKNNSNNTGSVNKIIKIDKFLIIYHYKHHTNLLSKITELIKTKTDIIIIFRPAKEYISRFAKDFRKSIEQKVNIEDIQEDTHLKKHKTLVINGTHINKRQTIACDYYLHKTNIIKCNQLLQEDTLDILANMKNPYTISSSEYIHKRISVHTYIHQNQRTYIIKAPQNTDFIRIILCELIREFDKYKCNIIILTNKSTGSASLVRSIALKGFASLTLSKSNGIDQIFNQSIDELEPRQAIIYEGIIKLYNKVGKMVFNSNNRIRYKLFTEFEYGEKGHRILIHPKIQEN